LHIKKKISQTPEKKSESKKKDNNKYDVFNRHQELNDSINII